MTKEEIISHLEIRKIAFLAYLKDEFDDLDADTIYAIMPNITAIFRDTLRDLKNLDEVAVKEEDLLIDFMKWCDDGERENPITEDYVHAYLKSINKCGRIES